MIRSNARALLLIIGLAGTLGCVLVGCGDAAPVSATPVARARWLRRALAVRADQRAAARATAAEAPPPERHLAEHRKAAWPKAGAAGEGGWNRPSPFGGSFSRHERGDAGALT